MNYLLRSSKHLIALAFLCMAVFGFVENLKGTAIPPIRDQFGVNYGSIGIMLMVSSMGYLIATFLGGYAGDRFGLKKILILGFMLLISSCLLMIFAQSFIAVVVLFFIFNSGFGFFEVGVNSLGARIFVRNSALMMNLMHLFYGLGSSGGPKFAGWMLEKGVTWDYTYFYSVILSVAVLIYLCFISFPEQLNGENRQKTNIKTVIADVRIWLFVGVLGFCEVIELGTGNWLVNFLQKEWGMNVDNSSFYLSFFFITFTLGRLFGGYIAEKLGYVRIIFIFTVASLALFLSGLILGRNFAFLFSLTGFFISIMFPTIMAIIMKEFKDGTGTAMGLIITASGTVNMLSNWLIGKTNDFFGVTYGFSSLLLYGSLIIVFLLLLDRKLVYNKGKADILPGA